MPAYDYLCRECAHEWEAEQRITDVPLRQCPACERDTAQRQISGSTSFALKGTRWARDGYR